MMGRVRVIIAPEDFRDTLTAHEAAAWMSVGWHRHAPDDDLDICPLSDGGSGFVQAVHTHLVGRWARTRVPGPRGAPADAAILVADGTAYIESAAACGLSLVPEARRDPGRSSSRGLGLLLAEALATGARRVVVGLGDVVTNDGGAGLLAGLAEAFDVPDLEFLGQGGLALRSVTAEQLRGLVRVREKLAGVEILAAADSDVTLLGFKGVSSLHAASKGATPEVAQALDLALADFARAAVTALDLPQRLVADPGSGAAGGLGFGLALLGARREPGASVVADAVGLPERLAEADLVVTGEGCLDWQSLRGTVLTAVAMLAQKVAVPVVAVPGQLMVGRRELVTLGVESAYPVARTPAEVKASLADPGPSLADRAERVARTWSPRRGGA
jgi:glycerate 2-kinase